MKYLKAGTAAVILMGPAVDKTDGVTAETALTPTVYLSKNGGAQAARNDATAITHDARGYYLVTLNATDTNTAGRLRALFSSDADHLPVWEDYTVLPAQVYDSIIAGTDKLDVAVTEQANIDFGALQKASLDAATPASVGSVTAGVTLAADALDAASLKADAIAEIVAAVLAAQVETEGTYTVQQVLSITLAVLAGVTANGGASLKTPNGIAVRVAATINTSSERTAMTLTPSA